MVTWSRARSARCPYSRRPPAAGRKARTTGVAVVTGGGSGIGAATVRRLAADGYSVAIIDVRPAEAQAIAAEIGPSALAYEAGVTDPGGIAEVMASIEERQGPIEVLVNNAGVISDIALMQLHADEFRRVMDVNVTGVFVCTQAAARRMIASGAPGRIVNLGSINSRSVSTAGLAHYAASKGAVHMLTRASALELAPYGIRVNAVGPGIVETPLVAESLKDPQRRSHFLGRIPRGSITRAEDVAEVICMLANPALAAVTGELLVVDGGELIGGARID